MKPVFGLLALLLASFLFIHGAAEAQPDAGPAILHAAEAAKILPSSVFFRGKSASTQARNAAGVRFSDGMYVLASLVDTSGYSTGVQEKYQGYLLTEVPLRISNHALAPGSYGIGFTGDESHVRFHVMDIGDHELLQAPGARDAQMPRPVPLQVVNGTSDGLYRLCFGRECVNFRRAP